MMRDLVKHPDSSARAVRGMEVDVERAGDELRLSYLLRGDVADIAWPTATAPARTNELWRHTCFEAFVRTGAGLGYYEFNFSPSRQWAIYRFDSYRQGMVPAFEFTDPRIEVVSGAESFGLTAIIAMKNGPLTLALSAVIEEKTGGLSYWALAHALGKPDFHHADGFALELR